MDDGGMEWTSGAAGPRGGTGPGSIGDSSPWRDCPILIPKTLSPSSNPEDIDGSEFHYMLK